MIKKEAIAAVIAISFAGIANAASNVDTKLLAAGTWNCSINGNAQQWKFDAKNGFTMNGERGTYKVSGNNMDLVMGSATGTVNVKTLTNDKLVFQDSDGTTNCGKAAAKSGKQGDGGGLAGRGHQMNFSPF